MSQYEIYTFILCMIVMVAFSATFTWVITSNIKMHIVMVGLGQLDDQIIKSRSRGKNRAVDILVNVISWILMIALLAVFLLSLRMYLCPDCRYLDLPTVKVVKTTSMQTAHASNTYLQEDNVTDRLNMFDLVVVHPLPAEEELEQYDIVVYRKDDMEVIHRIIAIEEPNEKHPDERQFLLKGDANQWSDEFPVLYSQMTGIYEGQRVAFAGSFVLFMQSPAGWFCILLAIFVVIITPRIEKKVLAEEDKRLIAIGYLKDEKDEQTK